MPRGVAGAADIALYGRGINAAFFKFYNLAPDHPARQLLQVVTDEADIVDFPIPEALPMPRPWKGGRAHKGFKLGKQTVSNVPYEATLDFPGHHVRLGKMKQYLPTLQMLARRARLHWLYLLGGLLNGAFAATKAHDGKALCATNHSIGRGVTINNKGTAALSGDAFAAGRAELFTFADEQNSYRWTGAERIGLVVSPDLEDTAEQIIKAERGSSGESNVRKGKADIVVVPQLHDNPTYWFLSILDFAPFVEVTQEKLVAEMQDQPSSSEVYDHDVYSFGMRGRYAVAAADYRSIWGSDGSA